MFILMLIYKYYSNKRDKGRLSQKTVKLMTFIKNGWWGQKFMKTNFFFVIVTLGGGGLELCMTQYPYLNFSLFNLFLAHLQFAW